MKKKYSFLVVSFFRVTNPYSGASEVSYNFFKNIPVKDKKLIQYSETKQNTKNIKTVVINSKIDKIFKITELVNLSINHLKNTKNPVVIIEGASWVGYSFLFYIFLKRKLKNAKFIYHSHNIEYLLRRKKNNIFISFLSKYFENYIGKNFDIFTCVSNSDEKIIKQTYNFKTRILPNGIYFPKIKKIKAIKLKYNYVFFCGSIDYLPNKQALDILVDKVMPIVIKKNPSIKLVISGNNKIPYKKKYLINIGFVSKYSFYRYLKGAALFVNPMKTAFGSQVKMISALVFGKAIVASKKATFGLDINNNFNKIYIAEDPKKFAKLILNNITSNKFNKNNSKFYQNKYSIKKITSNFINGI